MNACPQCGEQVAVAGQLCTDCADKAQLRVKRQGQGTAMRGCLSAALHAVAMLAAVRLLVTVIF